MTVLGQPIKTKHPRETAVQHRFEQRTISKRSVLAVASTLVLAMGTATLGAAAFAADTPADQSPSQDVKDSANSAKKAAVKTGRNAKHGVKKGVHRGAAKVDEGAKKVESKTPSE